METSPGNKVHIACLKTGRMSVLQIQTQNLLNSLARDPPVLDLYSCNGGVPWPMCCNAAVFIYS